MNNCQFKEATDVTVSFDGEEVVMIYPEYVRTTYHYVYQEQNPLALDFMATLKQINAITIHSGISPWNRTIRVL